nr:lysylphosphatidylglycerol synthase transmembrane domain-containing protein [Salinicola sp. S1-1-2]
MGITLGLFGVLAWRLDTTELLRQLATLEPVWVLLALGIALPQVVLSAWRWRLTTQAVGLALPWRTAIAEYYLATFLNQILPGGVLGDATRAWRHGNRTRAGLRDDLRNDLGNDLGDGRREAISDITRDTECDNTHGKNERISRGTAVRAVIIERASGQLALIGVALVTLLASPTLRSGIAEAAAPLSGVFWAWLVAGSLVVVALGYRWRHRRGSLRVLGDARRALFDRGNWLRQLSSSLLVVATYVAVFLCAARALDLSRPLVDLLPLIPPLLMAMAIPLSIAGWGLREGAAALLWPLVGWPAQEGVTLSITYGVLILLGSLPGLVIFALGRRSSAHATGNAHPVATPSPAVEGLATRASLEGETG